MPKPDLPSLSNQEIKELQEQARDQLRRGDLAAAVHSYDSIIESAPAKRTLAKSLRADALRKMGHFERASRDYLEVIASPKESPNWIRRGVVRLAREMAESGDIDGACNVLSDAQKYLPNEERLKATLSLLKRQQEDDGVIPEVLPLPVSKLERCIMVPDRIEILKHVPKGGRMAELGTWQGAYAKEILRICQPRELHIIDLNLNRHPVAETFSKEIDAGIVKLYEGDSHDTLMAFEDEYFDYVYVDGDHSYRGASRDLAAAGLKTRTSGMIGVNDYTYWDARNLEKYGVMEALHEFLLKTEWKMHAFALNQLGHNDVLLSQH